jgi:DNA-binding XRE family transcriptional regulator
MAERRGPTPQKPGAAGVRLGAAARAALAVRFGERVRDLRSIAELSPDELAARCGTVSATISKIERGRPEPRLWQIVQLCRGLAVTPDTLLGELVGPSAHSHTEGQAMTPRSGRATDG